MLIIEGSVMHSEVDFHSSCAFLLELRQVCESTPGSKHRCWSRADLREVALENHEVGSGFEIGSLACSQ